MKRMIPVRQSGIRPHLVMGAEREPALLAMLAAALLVFVVMTWYSVLIAAVVWPLVHLALTRLAAVDPTFIQVYLRHKRFSAFYLAHGSPWTVSRTHWGL